jgi:hypothetical protein
MRGNVGGLGYNTTNNQSKGNKMTNATLEVGQTYTTTTSGVTGVIKAIEPHSSGVNRVLLDVAGKDRWTSVTN